jgi:ATP synthase protein I
MTAVRREVGVRSLLRPAVLAALGTGAICCTVGAVTAGWAGAAAAGLGTGLVLGFLLLGQLPLVQADRGRPGLGALMLLLGYCFQVLVLLVVFVLVVESDGPDRQVLGLTVIAVAMAWTAATVWRWLRWRPPVVDVELPSERRDPAR